MNKLVIYFTSTAISSIVFMYVSLNNEHFGIGTINFTVVQVVCFKTIVMDGGSEGPTVKHGIVYVLF